MTEQERRRDLILIALPLSVLAVIISLIVAGLVYLDLDQRATENRKLAEDTAELAERVRAVQKGREDAQRAADQAQVDSCYSRNAQGPALQKLLGAVRPVLADAEARAIIDDYIELSRQSTPTIRECHALADRLGLPRRTG